MPEPQVEPFDQDELVRRARDGDREAFGQLVRIHQHEVYTLALRLTADRDLAGDVAQEAFIRAWRAMPKFRGEAAFGTWLYRITVNVSWTLKSRRRHHYPIDEATTVPESSIVGRPEDAGVAAAFRESVKGALERIPVTQRTVVVLKDVYGWSHAEIADALGITVAAAKVRLHRGHTRLRHLLGKDWK